MDKYNVIYEENKELDKIFDKLYDNDNKDIIEKNIVELLVELGELANETKCFKYWSSKKPGDKEDLLEEYSDCIIMALYFCDMVNIDLNEEFIEINEKDLVNQFKTLYNLCSSLNYKLDRDLVKEVFANIVNLGKLLSLSDDEVIEGCLKKINKNYSRFETGF